MYKGNGKWHGAGILSSCKKPESMHAYMKLYMEHKSNPRKHTMTDANRSPHKWFQYMRSETVRHGLLLHWLGH